MEPKPAFLGPHVASAFQEASVIEAYPYRAPYPESLFQKLAELLTGSSRAVLDVGTGPGDVARRLAPYVERVDAVDWSAGMIALGQQLPGGGDPRIHWIQGRIEEVTLAPPYGLITAGESLHWMDWGVVLSRFATLPAAERKHIHFIHLNHTNRAGIAGTAERKRVEEAGCGVAAAGERTAL